ncbi:MAG: hypothetical protein AAF213_00920 [Pseudomonadota bacterium]
MSAFEWLANMATGIGLTLSGQACPIPPEPVVVVRPLEEPLKTDFTKTSVGINEVLRKPVAVPIPHTNRSLGGLMMIEMTAHTNVQFGGDHARDGNGTCIWPSRVDINLLLAGTLYVNQIYDPGSCMHDAIAEHEMEHYMKGKDLVLRELSTVQRAARAKVDEIGVIGPLSAEQARAQGGPIGDAITQVVQREIDRLNKEQEKVQAAHDTAIENLETATKCSGKGRYIHTPPQLPADYRN